MSGAEDRVSTNNTVEMKADDCRIVQFFICNNDPNVSSLGVRLSKSDLFSKAIKDYKNRLLPGTALETLRFSLENKCLDAQKSIEELGIKNGDCVICHQEGVEQGTTNNNTVKVVQKDTPNDGIVVLNFKGASIDCRNMRLSVPSNKLMGDVCRFYLKKAGSDRDLKQCRFLVDGVSIDAGKTVAENEIEHEDQIDVFAPATGGF